MKTSEEPVVVEQSFAASPDEVWRAITEVDRMRRWFFDNIPDFKPEIDFEIRFSVHSGGREFLHVWKITESVPGERLQYDWSYDGYPGDSFVLFELLPDEKATRLRLTATVREDFPDDVPEFKRESCQAGWEYFIQRQLRSCLEE